MDSSFSPIALLRWYLEAGVDEVVHNTTRNYYELPLSTVKHTTYSLPKILPVSPLPPLNFIMEQTHEKTHLEVVKSVTPSCLSSTDTPALHAAAKPAADCTTLADLHTAIVNFDGCALKTVAASTVFADGVPTASIMIIGEAPGIEEDRCGLPFVGPSGRLLDRMLKSIGLERHRNCYITNVIPWRPPGNRKPTPSEVASLLPFLTRHITLISPQILLLVGGLAASAIIAHKDGIMKLRGQWLEYSTGLPYPIPVLATFHPAYLLRVPAQKRLVWHDLLSVKYRLESLSTVRAVP